MNLADIESCFHGVVPSKIATCSRDGTPNAAYLSHVFFVDDGHVASSYQFFNKTRKNLMENPYASILVRHPVTLHPYVLRVKYLRSEETGPTYEKMSVKLDVIAAHEGMGNVFRLLAADIYEVLEILDQGPLFPESGDLEAVPADFNSSDLELLRVITEHLNRQLTLEDLLDESLNVLHRYLGWKNAIVLLNDEPHRQLVTYATLGYPDGGVGSEVKHGEGVIGMSALHKKVFQISGIQEGFRYTQAIRRSVAPTPKALGTPLPGLKNPASQIAAPILFRQELLGVIAAESADRSWWDLRDQMILTLVANHLAAGIAARDHSEGLSISQRLPNAPAPAARSVAWAYRYVDQDEVMFVNDQYLIKNLPAKILKYLLETYLSTGRRDFSNMELRTAKELALPEVKDNLETRMILLRKRLQEQNAGVRMKSTGRGKFALEIDGKLEFTS